jgi:hypothetical protein
MNMKRYVLPCIALLLTILPAESQVLRNLIPNPSFEYTGRDTVRQSPEDGWNFTATDDRVTGHATTSRAIAGFRSYLIRAETGAGVLESDVFDVDSFERYLLSFALSGDGSIETTIRWHRYRNEETELIDSETFSPVAASEGWAIEQYTVQAPRRADGVSVLFTVHGGQVWIDDVRFRRSPR